MSAAHAERITTTKNGCVFLSIPMAFQSGAAQATNNPYACVISLEMVGECCEIAS
jgi:hypothetical protein